MMNFPKHVLFQRIVVSITILVPFTIAMWAVVTGNFSLWYDNARDLLAAWNNLNNLTLLGPTSGIPGIFYGPYWIWLLSFGVALSQDPRVVVYLTATLPYFILFPLVWFRFTKFFGITAVVIGWCLFIFSTGMTYATNLWNPYPAPLIALTVVYLLLRVDFLKLTQKAISKTLLLGFLLGLVINFHISFGIGFSLGVGIFLLLDLIRSCYGKKKLQQIIVTKMTFFVLLGVGFFAAFLPFLLFEVRHGFTQTTTLIKTLGEYGAVVGLTGLTKPQILQEFIDTFSLLLHIPPYAGLVVLCVLLSVLIVGIKQKKFHLSQNDTKILTLIASLFVSIGFIYFSARNPVWEYHFIGVDIFFLLLITFIISKISFFQKVLGVWTIYIIGLSIVTFSYVLFESKVPFLEQQKALIATISEDAGTADYTVIAYSPSIYMYEYTYLFRWLENKYVPYDPSQNEKSEIIYLIIPKKADSKINDFIHFRSPSAEYETVKKWENMDDNQILKRVKKAE